MSRENVEIVRRAMAANRSGPAEETVEVAVDLWHPAGEFTSRLSSVEGATYRGDDGARRYFEDLADAFEEWTNEPHSIEALSPTAVLADSTFRGVARSGVGVELRSATLWILDEGKVVGLHSYGSREEALEAADALE